MRIFVVSSWGGGGGGGLRMSWGNSFFIVKLQNKKMILYTRLVKWEFTFLLGTKEIFLGILFFFQDESSTMGCRIRVENSLKNTMEIF